MSVERVVMGLSISWGARREAVTPKTPGRLFVLIHDNNTTETICGVFDSRLRAERARIDYRNHKGFFGKFYVSEHTVNHALDLFND